jgi:hypothetical protein
MPRLGMSGTIHLLPLYFFMAWTGIALGLLGILIFKGLTARRLYKLFGVKGLMYRSVMKYVERRDIFCFRGYGQQVPPNNISLPATLPKFAGSNPAEAVGFFSGEKILSMPSFGREVKPFAPCRRFAAC